MLSLHLFGNCCCSFIIIFLDSSSSHTYEILKLDQWPTAELLGLDPSQVEALKSALTKELSIIQGPPGTGKTYVGLMIMKILLANRTSLHALERK